MSSGQFQNYINGTWVSSGSTFENRNPADTREVVGVFAKGSAKDVAAAATAAQAAFPAWSKLPGPARGAYLFKDA
jgi:alpha-ketoglutaric semialdehyde dehydrogenase